jgi:hypothetical protein
MVNDPYTKITSPFIRERLSKTKWLNHSYIDDLLFLERYINISPRSFASVIHFWGLKKQYQKEFLKLCKEQSFERYQKEKRLIEKEEALERKRKDKRKENQEELLNNWIKAGGLE